MLSTGLCSPRNRSENLKTDWFSGAVTCSCICNFYLTHRSDSSYLAWRHSDAFGCVPLPPDAY